uniref:YhhN-like protein n=1 Tax=viral metagenome TaxID=1070528 RepID=A0A6C0E3T8_9ZZZZ
MNEYTFPFNTCETPNKKGIAQPYSAMINFLSVIIVLYFLSKTQTLHAFILLFSLLLFDLSHTFSHFTHINTRIQLILVHSLAYILNFAFLYALYKHTNKLPSTSLIIFLLFILSFDIYAFFNLHLLCYLFTYVLFLFSIFIYYYGSLSKSIKKRLNILLILISIIYLGFINEAINCKRMLTIFPNFPFHAIVEILILFALYLFCTTFYNI